MLQSIRPKNFLQFIMNYHMNKLDSTLLELLNMLKITEGTLKKKCHVLLIQSSRMSKKKSKRNKSHVSNVKKPIGGIKIRGTHHHCGKDDH